MNNMKKLTKKRIKEEILRCAWRQEYGYWRGIETFLCFSFVDNELTGKMRKWLKNQGVLIGCHNIVVTSHFITNADKERYIDPTSCAAIFRTMILIEFAKSLGVKV